MLRWGEPVETQENLDWVEPWGALETSDWTRPVGAEDKGNLPPHFGTINSQDPYSPHMQWWECWWGFHPCPQTPQIHSWRWSLLPTHEPGQIFNWAQAPGLSSTIYI